MLITSIRTTLSSHPENCETITAYDQNVSSYLLNTPQNIHEYAHEMTVWMENAALIADEKRPVLEIGSATNRDASFLRTKGLSVTCSDIVPGFLKNLESQGERPLKIDILNPPELSSYGMVFANGVFPHLTEGEAHLALANIYSILDTGGVLAFSAKAGEGEGWFSEKSIDRRFVHYWRQEQLIDALQQEGFRVVFYNTNLGSQPSHKWLNVVCVKILT